MYRQTKSTQEFREGKTRAMETNPQRSPTNPAERAASWASEFSSQPMTKNELTRRTEAILGRTLEDGEQETVTATLEHRRTNRDRQAGRERHQEFQYGQAALFHDDCFDWLHKQDDNSIHAVVTDPPYGLEEYTEKEQDKLRAGRGGIWRLPPKYDGNQRNPVPRFTVLTGPQLQRLHDFFFTWARYLYPKLRPGANVLIASNPLLAHVLSSAVTRAGLEKRGEIVRLVTTLRGGDRPKGANEEFRHVTVMPRSMWEPWVVIRKPLEGTVQNNLRRWETGGLPQTIRGIPFRGRDQVRAYRKERKGNRSTPEPETTGVPETNCPRSTPLGRRNRDRHLRRRRVHPLQPPRPWDTNPSESKRTLTTST